MKAIVVEKFGGPEELQVRDVPAPDPGPGQCLVRIEAAGVNPVETYIRAGTYAKKPELPFTPGTDGAGVVERAGRDVKHISEGNRVYVAGSITGTYAELAVCEESDLHPLPENVSADQGAAIGIPYATAYRALVQRGGGLPGETVLVHGGTGGVGVAAVQFARALGLRVLATGGTEEGRQLARREGAHAVFDHSSPGYEEEIRSRFGEVDLILEMLANVNLALDLGLLAKGGRVVVIGSRGRIEIDPRETMLRDADIRGMLLFNGSPRDMTAIHAAIGTGLENGTLRPVIQRGFPLVEAPAAHEAVMSSGSAGKIMLRPSE